MLEHRKTTNLRASNLNFILFPFTTITRLLKSLELLSLRKKIIKLTNLNHSLFKITVCIANLLSLFVIALCVLRAAPHVKRRDLLTVSVQAAISGCAAHVRRNTNTARKPETASWLCPWRAAQVLKMHFEILFLLISFIKLRLQALWHRHHALCVWHRRKLCVRERLCDFSITSGPLTQSAFRNIWKILNICVSQSLSFPPAFSVCVVTG